HVNRRSSLEKLVSIFLILSPFFVTSQDLGMINGLPARHFRLNNPQDTIDFMLVSGETSKTKPLLVFFQGSGPTPLIVIANGKKFFTTLNNFNFTKVAEEFHLVVIS